MKKIYFTLLISALLASCSDQQEPQPVNTTGAGLSVKVTDLGFTSHGRASDQGLTTEFTQGDRIGLFAVYQGSVVPQIDNMCLTATTIHSGGSLQWTSVEPVPDVPGAVYYAYYPYTPTLPTDVDPEATTADDFFSEMVSAWPIADDQSTYGAYTSSDLMTASATVTGGTLSIGMEHRMALVLIDFPTVKYVFTNTPPIPDYTLSGATELTFDGIQPYCTDASAQQYRVITNPYAETPVQLRGQFVWEGEQRSWQSKKTFEAGAASALHIDGVKSRIISHHLQVGDYLLWDGSLLSREASAQAVAASNVAGIVFTIDPDRIGPAEKAALGGVVHGSVLGLKDVDKPYAANEWCHRATDETLIGIPNVIGTDAETSARLTDAHISGLDVYQRIVANRSGLATNYELFYGLEIFDQANELAPVLAARTTGWYIPTAGQWMDIVRNLGGATLPYDQAKGTHQVFYWADITGINARINAAADLVSDSQKAQLNPKRWYWTSTQASASHAFYVQITDGANGLNSLSVFINPKNNFTFARPVLTF